MQILAPQKAISVYLYLISIAVAFASQYFGNFLVLDQLIR